MSNCKILLLTILLTLWSHLEIQGQQIRASLSHYSTEDGLASDAIADIVQDDYGYLWIGTWNGLSRFDGYNFYNHQTGNVSNISRLHNRILHLIVDSQQNIWMHMYDGRVFFLNRKTDMIMNPFQDVSGNEEFRTSVPPFKMNNGDLLVSFENVGIFRISLSQEGKPVISKITSEGYNVKCLVEGYHDDIWAGTDKGMHRIDLDHRIIDRKGIIEDETVTALYSNGYKIFAGCKSGSIYSYSYGQNPEQLRTASTGGGILSLFFDSHDVLWFADSRFGANRIKDGNEKHFEQRVLVPEHDGYGGVFSENDSIVWVRMNHGGYGYYNRLTDEVEYFHNDPSNPWNLSNTVNASIELKEGVIFMSTSRRGLDKLEIQKNNITRTLLIPNAISTIDNEIRGICYDSKRKLLLLGNKNNALFVIRADGSRTTITQDSNGNPIGRTYGISQDSKDNYWLSSKDHGLFKMTSKEDGGFTLHNMCHHQNDKNSLSSNAAYQTVEDKQGNLWVATYGGGVNVMTKDKNGRHIFLHPQNGMKDYPHNSYLKVRCIALADDGKIWAGTTDGILILSLNNGKVEIERMENSTLEPQSILMSTDIVCMVRDHKGSMWIGTNGGGLCHTTGRDAQGKWLFESFGTSDGLPSEEIRSITVDPSDNIWFASDNVLCSFNTSKKIFTTFSSLDGVDETLCSEGSAIALPNGNVIFGTLNGYYTVDRNRLIANNAASLKLRITDFFVDNELTSPLLNNYYDYYVPDAKKVTLPKHSSSFAFQFASLNYQLQHRILYQYKLEGYDEDWCSADKSRIARYLNVPTGRYLFHVKAFLLESPDKYDMRVIEVVVPPHFLLSGSVIWLYMMLIVIIALTIMLMRQRHLRKC